MDTEQFNVIQRGYITAIIVLGGALSITSLAVFCLSAYQVLKKIS